jgi:hypothetical protein
MVVSNMLKRLVAGFPPRRLGLDPGSGQVWFVVDKVALGQVFSEYFGFPCQSSFHQLLHNHPHLSSGAGTIGQKWPQYNGLSPTPLTIKKKKGLRILYRRWREFCCKRCCTKVQVMPVGRLWCFDSARPAEIEEGNIWQFIFVAMMTDKPWNNCSPFGKLSSQFPWICAVWIWIFSGKTAW